MGTVFIDRKDIELKVDGNSIAFYSNGKRQGGIPLTPLKRVVIVGNVKLDTSFIHRLVRNGISIVFFTGRLKYCGIINGPLHNNGYLRVKQYEKSLRDFAQVISKELIVEKILSQKQFIIEMRLINPILSMDVNKAIETMDKTLNTLTETLPSIESLRGIEGSISSIYFSLYCKLFPPSLKFSKRVKRPPTDPVNAMLSFVYTLIHYEMVREIQLIGLDPTIGFYHQFEYGRESLACDLVEKYRVSVDRFVFEIFRNRLLSSRNFTKDEQTSAVYLGKGGRKIFYPLYEEWAQKQRSLWRQEVEILARRILE